MLVQLGEVSTCRQLGGGYLFRLRGEFDMSNAWKIRDALLPVVRAGHHVVVDMTDVAFFDGRLVRVLSQTRLAAVRRGLRFRIVPPPGQEDVWRLAEAGEMRLAA